MTRKTNGKTIPIAFRHTVSVTLHDVRCECGMKLEFDFRLDECKKHVVTVKTHNCRWWKTKPDNGEYK